MMITIELPPEVEASFAALAAKQGVALPNFLLHLLEEQMPPRIGASLSPAERARLWRESAKGMPYTPPLSDAAVSRESFYDARGQMSVLVDTKILLAPTNLRKRFLPVVAVIKAR